MGNDFNKKDILSLKELDRDQIEHLLERAAEYKKEMPTDILQGKVLANCFFEPSTRTRLSFDVAMQRLGGTTVGFSSDRGLSVQKGETLHDTMKIMGQMADVIVLRHPLEGAARVAADATETVVINAGDGSNEHPTQTLLDLFSIQECQGKIDGLNIVFAGDLKHSRTIHSLIYALRYFDCRLFFVSPPELCLSDEICDLLRTFSMPFSFHTNIEEVMHKADILYVTRMQKERFSDAEQYERLKKSYRINTRMLECARKNLKILHPLPRQSEIALEVDESAFSYYFIQAENGVYIRSALLAMVLGL